MGMRAHTLLVFQSPRAVPRRAPKKGTRPRTNRRAISVILDHRPLLSSQPTSHLGLRAPTALLAEVRPDWLDRIGDAQKVCAVVPVRGGPARESHSVGSGWHLDKQLDRVPTVTGCGMNTRAAAEGAAKK